jgi:hypothetical protein
MWISLFRALLVMREKALSAPSPEQINMDQVQEILTPTSIALGAVTFASSTDKPNFLRPSLLVHVLPRPNLYDFPFHYKMLTDIL